MSAKTAEREHDWSEFISRMACQFEELLQSKPSRTEDIVHELRKHDDSLTLLEPLRRLLPSMHDTVSQVISGAMQHDGYYASVEGPWLICSRTKKQHDAMVFAAQ